MSIQRALSVAVIGAVGFMLAPVLPAQETAKPPSAQKPDPAAPKPEMVQKEGGANEAAAIRAAVAAPKPSQMTAVVMQFSGTFDDLPSRFEEFTKTFEAQGLSKRKLAANPTGIYVVYEEPEGKTSYKLGVGVQVRTKLEVKEPLTIEAFNSERAVRLAHVGRYQELGRLRNAIVKEAEGGAAAKALAGRRSGFPIVARLLNDPRKVPDNQRRTELIVPF